MAFLDKPILKTKYLHGGSIRGLFIQKNRNFGSSSWQRICHIVAGSIIATSPCGGFLGKTPCHEISVTSYTPTAMTLHQRHGLDESCFTGRSNGSLKSPTRKPTISKRGRRICLRGHGRWWVLSWDFRISMDFWGE